MFSKIKRKKIIILIGFLLVLLVFTFWQKIKIKAEEGAVCSEEPIFNNTESIFDFFYCYDGSCSTRGPNGEKAKELFVFSGHDAGCQEEAIECDEIDCSNLNWVKCIRKKRICRLRKTLKCQGPFTFGPAGTMKAAGKILVHGQRTYLVGGDNLGIHWIKTSRIKPTGQAVGFKNQDVYFGHNLKIKDSVTLSGEVDKNKIIWDSLGGEEYIERDRNYNFGFHSDGEETLSIRKEDNYAVQVKNGLRINGILNTDNFVWRGDTGAYRTLHWSPILGMYDLPNASHEGKSILFYCDPAPTAGSCP